ncbi:class F sortase [Rothia sp. HC945]|jgi:hypothetical protein|uniref:class F sortase n=1 Tax=Rothia sp. HC945 TaxID=3171170 RepID=UPI0026539E25|nr:class F sortase [Kocuria sp.]
MICAGLLILLLTALAQCASIRNVPLLLRHPELMFRSVSVSPEGHRLVDRGPDRTALDADTGGQYAPRPHRAFRHASCTGTTGSETVPPIEANSWHAPSLGAQATFVPVRTDESGEVPLPSAPGGAWDDRSAPAGSPTGSTFLAGHVNHSSGRLSPWGRLHDLEPCAPIEVADANGGIHTYRVTDLYVVPQEGLKDLTALVAKTGPPRLNLVTCSGPEVSEVADGRFDYRDNLVVRAESADEPPR